MKWIVGIFFVLSRFFILMNPPTEFSQITYVYMPYAHLWASGELPYLNQWYEYPPLTLPLFYIPHLIDMATNHHWYHLNYSAAYKISVLFTDAAIFALVWLTLNRLKTSKSIKYVSLGYYSLVTAKTNHFIYDSFDLFFIAVIVFGLVAPILWKNKGKFFGWVAYFIAAGIKYVNLPLGLPIAISQRYQWKKVIIQLLVASILTLGIPVLYFRSSLLVTLEYHKQRGLQVESAPATIARTINQWTGSENYAEVSKAYDIQGPVSNQLKQIFGVLFPASIIIYTLYSSYRIYKTAKAEVDTELIWITLGFICLFMVTSPVLSTPYLLWHIPLVALVSTRNMSQKLKLIIPSLIIIMAGMTKIPDLPIGMLSIHILIGWVKIVGFTVMLIQVMNHLRQSHRQDTQPVYE